MRRHLRDAPTQYQFGLMMKENRLHSLPSAPWLMPRTLCTTNSLPVGTRLQYLHTKHCQRCSRMEPYLYARVSTETLWDSPDSLGALPSFNKATERKLVHPRTNVFELAAAVVTATVAIARGASSVLRNREQDTRGKSKWRARTQTTEYVALIPIMYVSCITISEPAVYSGQK